MVDLGVLGGDRSSAGGINASGVVVGGSVVDDAPRAFLWTPARGMRALPFFDSFACGINDRDQIVGYDYHLDLYLPTAFLWSKDQGARHLETLGGSSDEACRINNSGFAVGGSLLPGDNAVHAVIWTRTGPIDLGAFGGIYSFAEGINDLNEVVGYSEIP
jgi:probable HAF family extracellular repeat protein